MKHFTGPYYEAGTVVRKHSKRPFKSGLSIATITGTMEHPQLPGELAYTFAEDDSYVRCSTVTPLYADDDHELKAI